MTHARRLTLATLAWAALATAALLLLERKSARWVAITDEKYPTLRMERP